MSEKADQRGCPPGAGTIEPEHGGQIGNPPHEVTEEMRAQVRLLAKVSDQEVIAATLKISPNTLRRHYHDDYLAGRREAIQGVKSKLLTQALGGSVNAAWKYLQLMGEVKRQPIAVTGPDGGPVQTVDVDLTRLSGQQLKDYGRLAALAEGIDPDSILFEIVDDAESDQP
jgi:hypothetical protein